MGLSTIGVGLIGCGLMGYRHGMALNTIRGVRIPAVTDLLPTAAARLARQLGAEAVPTHRDLLARHDIDAVVIAVSDDSHLEPALDAVAAHKHVLLEKPLATSLDHGRRILSAAERMTDRVFMVGHLLRFDPRFVGAMEKVANGDIGDIVHITMRRNSSVEGPRRYEGRARLHLHVSTHDADLLRFLTGQSVERVYAQATRRVLDTEGQYDSLFAILNLSSGALCAMEACWVLPPSYRSALDGFVEIVGTQGVIYVDTLQQGLTVVDQSGFHYPDTVRYWEHDRRGYGLVRAQAEHFIDCIDRQCIPKVTVRDGYDAIRICQALRDSIDAGRPVSLPD